MITVCNVFDKGFRQGFNSLDHIILLKYLNIIIIFCALLSCNNKKLKTAFVEQKKYTSILKHSDFSFIKDSSYQLVKNINLDWEYKKKIIEKLLKYKDSNQLCCYKAIFYGNHPSPCYQIYLHKNTEYTLSTESMFLINLVIFEEINEFSPYPSFKKKYLDSTNKFSSNPALNVKEFYQNWYDNILKYNLTEKQAKLKLLPAGNFWLNCYNNWEYSK